VLNPSDIPLMQWTLAVVQILTFIALAVYVWKTWEIAKANRDAAKSGAETIEEMRAAREAASAPQVAIYLSAASNQAAEIVLENYGDGTAADVLCTFDPPLQTTHQGDPGRFFEIPKWLPPRSRLTHGLDVWADYLRSDLPRRYNVKVAYQDVTRTKRYSVEYALDVSAFEHMLTWERKGVPELARVAESLRTDLRSVMQDSLHIERSRDNARDLVPISSDADEAVSIVLAAWELFGAMQSAPDVTAFDGPFLPVMRRATAAALAGAIRHGRSAEIQQLVKRVFVCLHHNDYRVMVDRAPARRELAQAIEALRLGWNFRQ
jgi:hypothetical protein